MVSVMGKDTLSLGEIVFLKEFDTIGWVIDEEDPDGDYRVMYYDHGHCCFQLYFFDITEVERTGRFVYDLLKAREELVDYEDN